MLPASDLAQKINVKFSDVSLLELALIHRSYINESGDRIHNERLEFLGDAVLELVVTEFLYAKFPDQPEGELTSQRSALVKGDHLAQVARRLEIGEYLRMSRGEERGGGREKDYLLANAVEAIIGAIYLDQGYEVAKVFITQNILIDMEEILANNLHVDSKSYFQETAQEKRSITPTYKLIKEEGPDHDKIFTMGAYLEDELIASGTGGSKQSAEQEAAKSAILKMQW